MGRHGKKIKQWSFSFDGKKVLVDVYLRSGNTGYGRAHSSDELTARNEEYEISERGTDIQALENVVYDQLKVKVVSTWEPWLTYTLRLNTERHETGKAGLTLEWDFIDRCDVGLPSERYRSVNEHEPFDGKVERNVVHRGTQDGSPETGYDDSYINRDKKTVLHGCIRDTPQVRLAFSELEAKLRELYTRLAFLLEPERGEKFLAALGGGKLLLELPVGKSPVVARCNARSFEDLPKLSEPQLQALRGCDQGEPEKGCAGRSSHGGRVGTLGSLQRLGLIGPPSKGYALTPQGRIVLEANRLV